MTDISSNAGSRVCDRPAFSDASDSLVAEKCGLLPRFDKSVAAIVSSNQGYDSAILFRDKSSIETRTLGDFSGSEIVEREGHRNDQGASGRDQIAVPLVPMTRIVFGQVAMFGEVCLRETWMSGQGRQSGGGSP